MKISNILKICFLIFMVVACQEPRKKQEKTELISGLERAKFQTEINGKQTDLYVLKNKNGMEVCITNYGGRIVSVMVPDRKGVFQDVVLGFDNIDDYVRIDNNFGATIGRYGNRIAHGKIVVEGVEYQLPTNNFGHCLHGGDKGFHTQVFEANQADNQCLELSYLSVDGEAGFPGNLQVKVVMTLTDDNAIDIQYEAKTDKETIVNLTNHSYFNLSGNPKNTILGDILMINADGFTPIDETFMTIGTIENVEKTPLDFRKPTPIGERIEQYDFVQLKNADGYDHNWVLNTNSSSDVAATLFSPLTGIKLEVRTDEPGLQVYSGNFLDGKIIGKKGIAYQKRTAICLETQKYPNSPNNPTWVSPYLKVGETYKSRCVYKFSVEK